MFNSSALKEALLRKRLNWVRQSSISFSSLQLPSVLHRNFNDVHSLIFHSSFEAFSAMFHLKVNTFIVFLMIKPILVEKIKSVAGNKNKYIFATKTQPDYSLSTTVNSGQHLLCGLAGHIKPLVCLPSVHGRLF